MRTLQERCKNHSSLRPNQEEYSWLIEIVVFIPTLMLRNSLGKSHSDDESDRSKTTNRWEKICSKLDNYDNRNIQWSSCEIGC